jgi:hypothetical protein
MASCDMSKSFGSIEALVSALPFTMSQPFSKRLGILDPTNAYVRAISKRNSLFC